MNLHLNTFWTKRQTKILIIQQNKRLPKIKNKVIHKTDMTVKEFYRELEEKEGRENPFRKESNKLCHKYN